MARWYITPIIDKIVNGERIVDSIVIDNPAVYGLLTNYGINQVLPLDNAGNPRFLKCLIRVQAVDYSLIDADTTIRKIPARLLDNNLTVAEITAINNYLQNNFNIDFTGTTIRQAIRRLGRYLSAEFNEEEERTGAG